MSDDWSYCFGYLACAVAFTVAQFFETPADLIVSVVVTIAFGLIEIKRQAKKK